VNTPNYHSGPANPTPQQRLLLMDDVQWEAFIERCVRQLQKEGQYVQVIRLGGANDKGRDVCGYTCHPPSADTWDLYQAKYYGGTLSPSEVIGELAKFLTHVHMGAYSRPRRYYLCALKVGATLQDYLLNPDSMRDWVMAEWERKNGDFGQFKRAWDPAIRQFLLKFPFAIICRRTPDELLEIHARNYPEHWQHFGVLGTREPNPEAPDIPDPMEERYLKALLYVYQEKTGQAVTSIENIPRTYLKHFAAQRRLFYSAEGLHRFSRDKLPGAFDALLDDVEIGVSGVACTPYDCSLARLTNTLLAANSLQVNDNPLHYRLQAGDLQGTCHHLVNLQRLAWEDANEE
jgi:hypothetical protein